MPHMMYRRSDISRTTKWHEGRNEKRETQFDTKPLILSVSGFGGHGSDHFGGDSTLNIQQWPYLPISLNYSVASFEAYSRYFPYLTATTLSWQPSIHSVSLVRT